MLCVMGRKVYLMCDRLRFITATGASRDVKRITVGQGVPVGLTDVVIGHGFGVWKSLQLLAAADGTQVASSKAENHTARPDVPPDH